MSYHVLHTGYSKMLCALCRALFSSAPLDCKHDTCHVKAIIHYIAKPLLFKAINVSNRRLRPFSSRVLCWYRGHPVGIIFSYLQLSLFHVWPIHITGSLLCFSINIPIARLDICTSETCPFSSEESFSLVIW